MGRPIRYLPYPDCLVDVTAQTFQGRKFLRPDPDVTDVVLGILGKALQLYPDVQLVAYQIMSTHPHTLPLAATQEALSRFMQFVQTNISKEVGTRIRDWPGTFWHARFAQAPILDAATEERRLRHLLENSVKEGLVESIEEWPGANCVKTLLTGVPNVGTWYDRTTEYEARRRKGGGDVRSEDFGEKVEVPLVALPSWAHLPQEERVIRVRTLLDDIRDEHAAKRAQSKATVLGVEKVLAADPIERPAQHKRRDRVWCHTASRRVRKAFLAILHGVSEAYDAAAAAFRGGDQGVEFPEGTFRPQGAFVQWSDAAARGPLDWIEGLSLA